MKAASKLTDSSGAVGLQLQWASLQEEDELETSGHGRAEQTEVGFLTCWTVLKAILQNRSRTGLAKSLGERKRAIVSFCQRPTWHCAGSSAVYPALPNGSLKRHPVGLAEASSEPD